MIYILNRVVLLVSIFWLACDPSGQDRSTLMQAGTESMQMFSDSGMPVGNESDMQVGSETDMQVGSETDMQAGSETDMQAGSEVDMMGGDRNPAECEASPRRLRRLSHREYRNTLRDLLDIDISEVSSLVADPKRGGFDQDPHLLEVSLLLAENYQAIAESVADLLIQNQHSWLQLSCEDHESHGVCVYHWILTRGDQIFRRPMRSDEADLYYNLYQEVAMESCPQDGLKWVLIALLQSPHFLYRTELGTKQSHGDFAINAYERANLLSYLLWQSMPDDELFAAASNQSLMTDEGVLQHIERMMQDPKHDRTLNAFLDQWLGLLQIIEVTRDPIVYAAFYFELREMMLNETRLFFKSLWDQGASFDRLFSTQQTWINQPLAEYYSLNDAWNQSDQEQEVVSQLTDQATTDVYRFTALDDRRRGGLLTQGSLLTIYAHATSSSPIHRGLFIRDRLLCETLPPPPENLDIELPTHTEDQDTRTLFQEHSSDPVCQGCHQFIDPIGFLFEAYDGVGRWRNDDQGFPINDEGSLLFQDSSSVMLSGAGALAEYLSESDIAKRCYVRQWMRFAQGEKEEIQAFGVESDALRCEINQLTQESIAQSNTLSSPLEALAFTLVKKLRRGQAEDLDLSSTQMVDRISQSQANLQEFTPSTECQEGPLMGGDGDFYRDLTPGLVLTVNEDRWDTGACLYFTINNPTTEALTWSVSVLIEGDIGNAWNCQRDADSQWVNFQGVEWNQEIPAMGRIEFGLCMSL